MGGWQPGRTQRLPSDGLGVLTETATCTCLPSVTRLFLKASWDPVGRGAPDRALRLQPGSAAVRGGDRTVQTAGLQGPWCSPCGNTVIPSETESFWFSLSTTQPSSHRPGCLKRKRTLGCWDFLPSEGGEEPGHGACSCRGRPCAEAYLAMSPGVPDAIITEVSREGVCGFILGCALQLLLGERFHQRIKG